METKNMLFPPILRTPFRTLFQSAPAAGGQTHRSAVRSTILSAVCLLLTVSGCRKADSPVVPTDSRIRLNLVCQTVEDVEETRCGTPAAAQSASQTADSEINDLTLFLYNSRGQLISSHYVEKPFGAVSLAVRDGEACHLYAVANVGDWSARIGAVTETGLRKMYWSYSPQEFNPQAPLPMSCTLRNTVLRNGSSLTLSFRRLVARFRFLADTSALDASVERFRIKSVRLRNLNREVLFFADSRTSEADQVIAAGLPHSGGDIDALFGSGLDLYVPENKWGDLLPDNGDEQTHIPPAPYDSRCTYVEFTVDYRSRTRYDENLIYRYYLHDGRRLDNFDVDRNTMYLCRTHFVGSGLNENTWRIDLSGMKDRVTGIRLRPESHTFTEIGATLRIRASVTPPSAENPVLEWSSSDPDVAVVAPDGTVTATGDGTCLIRAVSTDGTGIRAEARISVDSRIRPESVTVSPAEATTWIGGRLRLIATVLPVTVTDPTVTWHSDDPAIATVDAEGNVTGRGFGTAVIRATARENGLSGEARITVAEKTFAMDPVPVLYPNYNSPWTISHQALPDGSPVYTISQLDGWRDVLRLEGNRLTALFPQFAVPDTDILGTYRLTGELNGLRQQQTVTVSCGIIAFNQPSILLCQGVSTVLEPDRLVPADIPIEWYSMNSQYVYFDKNGRAEPICPGKAKVIARTSAGAQQTLDLQVVEPTLRFLYPEHIPVYENERTDLSILRTPIQATELELEWKIVRGAEYASIDSDGILTGIRRSPDRAVTVRVSYAKLPAIFDELQVTVKPVVRAEWEDGNRMANFSLFPSVRPVDGLPGFLNIKYDHAPFTGIRWEIRRADGSLTGDLNVSASGRISAASASASGKYTIQGFDDTGKYATSVLTFYVYRYLEYQIGLETYKSELVRNPDDPAETEIHYTYSMNSRWHSRSWNWMISATDAGIPVPEAFFSRRILRFPESSREQWSISASPEANIPQTFVTDYEESTAYNPQFTVWDDLVPRSWLSDDITGENASGLTGISLVFGPQAYYYIRQDGSEFYNRPS